MIKEGEESIRISRHSNQPIASPAHYMAAPTPPPAEAVPSATVEQAPETTGHKVLSPMVGAFYSAPSPTAPPFVEVGQKVKVGDVLCIVEAMKMMNQINADKAGTVDAVLVENGQPVEFDQPLFIIV